MKRFFYFLSFAAVSLVAAISCSKENMTDSSLVSQEPLTSLTIPASKAAVKTVMAAEDGSVVHWSEGDALVVFDDRSACGGHRFDGTIQADASQSQFSGEVHLNATHIYALYPYDAAATFDGTNLVTTLPVSQTATLGSFANGAALAFGQADIVPGAGSVVGGLQMQNLCAVISFKMPSYVDGAQQVVVTSRDGKAIAGTATLNVGSGSLSVDGSSSVTVGVESLAAGAAYYAVVAPGSYPSGFSFRVKTASGKEYTAVNPNSMQLAAGGLYALGTVGLVLDVTPVVTITHTTTNGELSGSTAVLSPISVDDEWASMITAWSVELRRPDGTVVRRLSASSGTMSVANEWTYLPQGQYNIVAQYTSKSGAVKQLTGTATAPAPSVSVTLGGYCSYDEYAKTNGRTGGASEANKLNAETVYELSVKVNVANDLLNSEKYTASWSYTYDGVSSTFSGNSVNIGNKTGQSWGKHTLTATCTFDGVTGNASRDLHVTGLPYRVSPPTNSGAHPWSKMEGTITWKSDCVDLYYSAANFPRIGSPSFDIPENIEVSVSTKVVRNKYVFLGASVHGKLFISLQDDKHELYRKDLKSEAVYESTLNTTMTNSLRQFRIQYEYAATGPRTYVYYFNVLYR